MFKSYLELNESALLNNIRQCKKIAPSQRIIAMVKSNAYGHGAPWVANTLTGHVDAFGVAHIEEAIRLREEGCKEPCIVFQGVFSPDECSDIDAYDLECVIHKQSQLDWLLQFPFSKPIRVWVKVDTGMHRLGFQPSDVSAIVDALVLSPNISASIGILTHLACADVPNNSHNAQQIFQFSDLNIGESNIQLSIANSAAILALPETHVGTIRPGLMLYGVSPLKNCIGTDHNLIPVMRFYSTINVIHRYPAETSIGYSQRWKTNRNSNIAVIPVGYGDGYPWHVKSGTPVWINGHSAPIVGQISMDMMTVDLTDHPGAIEGDRVELWGDNIPVELIAKAAGTIPYELLCQITSRVHRMVK